jgi:signal transduction histidine kinase/ligand-binding sensor domain-containing protein
VRSSFFILCNAVWFALASPALAENENPFFARAWLAEDGLPDNRVVGLAQTSDGYLWVATQGGVVRFDGVRFQRVSLASSPDLIAGTMRALMLDRMGRVWLAKEEGGTLFCFDRGQVRMMSAGQGLPKNETQHSLATDGNGDLWVTYSTGKVIRYTHDGRLDTFTSKNGLPGGVGICWLASGRDGALWFAKGSQVGVFRNGRFNVLGNFGSPELRIVAARSGGIWICVGQKILRFDEGVETVELGKIIPDEADGRSSFNPSVLLEDRDGAVWVGTVSGGLYHCDSNAVTRVVVSNPAILSLASDREGNLWVGTRGGLNRVHRRLATIIKSTDGLPFQGVQSVCQDSSGALWLVGENGVLARGQGTNWVAQSPSAGSLQAYVTCAAADTNGSVWIGARRGALYYWADGQFKDLGLQSSLHAKAVRSLLVTSKSDLWIGTDAPDVLYRLRGEKLQSFSLPSGYRFIRAMAEDAAGNVWAGASDGLLVRVTGDDLVDETASSSSLSIRCLYGEANGDLWIGYAGAGAGRLRNGQITRFSTEQGLPNDYVAQILTDDRGNVWFAGNQGIFQVREHDFDDLVNGLATRVWPIAYGRNEGLPGLQASFDYCPDSSRSSDTRLFFSMLSGLAEVRLDHARLNYQPPNVFIERVTADNKMFATYPDFSMTSITNGAAPAGLGNSSGENELRLPPGLQQVQFEFTALSFVSPENVQFRYMLEGLDKDWVDAGTRRVAGYTHPPPGRYRFKVIACNNDGIWNKTGDTLRVTFEPYFWETLWFRFVMTLSSFAALCGVVVVVVRRRHRLVVERLEHQRALEIERNRIARDLHDDLGVGLTEIGLLGDLAGASGELPQAGRERLQEITGRARTLAASLDEIVWAINPVNDTSQSLVDYFFPYAQKLLGRAGIRCRLEVLEPLPAGSLNAEERHEFFHAYKEALNNIIRHSRATQVQVTMSAAGGNLLIRIADDGSGLEDTGGKGAHHGLAGMRERLLRLGGRCEIAGSAGKGTTVTFIIPVQSGA